MNSYLIIKKSGIIVFKKININGMYVNYFVVNYTMKYQVGTYLKYIYMWGVFLKGSKLYRKRCYVTV